MAFFGKKTSSGEFARDRLKVILVTDRMDNSAQTLEMMKNELLIVLQKYMHIDGDDFDLQIKQGHNGADESTRLKAEIPIRGMKRR